MEADRTAFAVSQIGLGTGAAEVSSSEHVMEIVPKSGPHPGGGGDGGQD